MTIFLLAMHILVCLALIGIVLIQGGKGADIGASFGAGASQTLFGASGGQTFIGKLTTSAAIIFMLTSLTLAIYWGKAGSDSIMPDQVAPVQAPATMPATEAPATAPADNQMTTPADAQSTAPAAPAEEAPKETAK
jgi:preprotein translocase subunit SecG